MNFPFLRFQGGKPPETILINNLMIKIQNTFAGHIVKENLQKFDGLKPAVPSAPPATTRDEIRIDAETLWFALGKPARLGVQKIGAFIKTAGDLPSLLSYRKEELVSHIGVPKDAADQIVAFKQMANDMARRRLLIRPLIDNYEALEDYLNTRTGHRAAESCIVLYLDSSNRLIKVKEQEGTFNHAPAYPREIAREAILNQATSVIIAHNHPSGTLQPSKADENMTRKITLALNAVGVAVHDHLICGRGQTAYSFAGAGKIKNMLNL